MFAKKNVVAAAALTLLAVAAQAQVTVYGNLDVSVGRKETATFTPGVGFAKSGAGKVDSNDLSQSYIGFKGQEDLGGGLKALFKLENALNLDTGASSSSSFWSRNAYVGLAGDFGGLYLGRKENLFKLEGQAFNPFGESQTFSPTFRAIGVDSSSWANSITYSSPNLGGLTLSAQASLGETQKATATNYAGGGTAISANFTAGPLALSAVYGDVRSTDGALTATGPASKDRAWLLGASYDFGVVKLYGQYAQDKSNGKSALLADDKTRGFQLGAGIPVTADGSVLVSYGDAKFTTEAANGSVKTRDLSVGYQHNLSKRTSAYAAVIGERQSQNLTTITPADKISTTSFAVGVRHAF